MTDARNKVPLVFAGLFTVVLIGLTAHKLIGWSGQMRAAGILFVGLYVLWLFLERRVALTEDRKGRTGADRGTCEAYALSRGITMISALALPTRWTEFGPGMMCGLAIFIAGVTFRLIAIRSLGQFYSHRVRVMKGHQVISHGPYRFVRHPAYSGMLLAHVGVAVFFFNPYTVAALIALLAPAIVLRIRVEETALYGLNGYSDYARHRPRLLPLVW